MMAQAVQLNRRLLLAIIRAPTPQIRLSCSRTHASYSTRSISTSNARLNTTFSVSFGEETDRRIRSLDEVTATNPTTKPKRKRTKKQESDHVQEDDVLKIIDSGGETSLPRRNAAQGSKEHEETILIEIDETSPAAVLVPEQSNARPRKRKDKKTSTDRPEIAETNSTTIPSTSTATTKPARNLEPWQIQKQALKQKLGGEAWNPRKKLSPDAMDGIRSLHEGDPERFSTEKLADHFKVSAEAIRRILRSKWRPSPEIMDERRARWAKRHDRIWDHKAEIGQRPRRRKDRQPEGPEKFEEEILAKQMLGQI